MHSKAWNGSQRLSILILSSKSCLLLLHPPPMTMTIIVHSLKLLLKLHSVCESISWTTDTNFLSSSFCKMGTLISSSSSEMNISVCMSLMFYYLCSQGWKSLKMWSTWTKTMDKVTSKSQFAYEKGEKEWESSCERRNRIGTDYDTCHKRKSDQEIERNNKFGYET